MQRLVIVVKTPLTLKYTLQGVPEQMSMRNFFLGHLLLLFSIVAWGRPYGFSDFVRELSSRSSSHLMLVTVSKSVRGMYVSKFKKVFMVALSSRTQRIFLVIGSQLNIYNKALRSTYFWLEEQLRCF